MADEAEQQEEQEQDEPQEELERDEPPEDPVRVAQQISDRNVLGRGPGTGYFGDDQNIEDSFERNIICFFALCAAYRLVPFLLQRIPPY